MNVATPETPDKTPTTFETKKRRLQRLKLVGVIAVFVVPLLAASLWFAVVDSFRPTATANQGELIQPARRLAEFSLPTPAGDEYGLDNLRRRWTLMYIARGQCRALCKQNLYHMRQVRIALGKDTDRVQRLFVMVNPENMPGVRDLLDQHQGIAWAAGSEDEMQGLVGQIEQASAGMSSIAEAIYLVDPLGNLMLRFPPDLDPRSMLKDLKRLLKVSRIG